MKIFVSGLPRSGKTTLVKKIYEEFKDKIKISGFYTEEISKNNFRLGFKIFSLDSKEEFIFAKKQKEENFNVNYAGYFLNLKVLEDVISKIDENPKLIIIDEIGKMEMLSEKFKNFIFKIMKSDKNVLATLHRSFINQFKNFGKVYWLSKENWENVYKEIKSFIENYL